MTREEAIQAVTRILVDYYQAERVYLVGSSARGEAHPESDLYFLVVVPDWCPREKLVAGGVHQALWSIPFPVDVVPFRRSTFEKRSGWVMALPAIALREGRLVYEASAVHT